MRAGQRRRAGAAASRTRRRLLNVSAMSYGSLSKNAVLALNGGAKIGGFAHNTGEGGLSPYHLEPRRRPHLADRHRLLQLPHARRAASASTSSPRGPCCPNVKMIEVKLSQGAKPGHGGILPAAKLTPEIVAIRGVVPGKDVVSPPAHTAFSTPIGLLQFLQLLRDASGGKPVGFKLCVGKRHEFLGIVKAMLESGIVPDFITVDGGEGGTGAAPLEFSDSVGTPLQRRAVVRPQRAGRRRPARPGAAHRLGQGQHRLRARHQGGARRRHVQRRAGDDVRARLHPGAEVQHQPVPDRGRDPGSRAGRTACTSATSRSASPATTARRSRASSKCSAPPGCTSRADLKPGT